ncbi:MAG: adenosine deaminase [Planctomycetota bacterium]
MSLDLDRIRELPKVLLHDHLDGGLRPETAVDLSQQQGKELPTEDPGELAEWFHRGAQRGNLPLYLEGFSVTCSVMQTEEALHRVAKERAQDLVKDGVVYAEIRFAPCLHVNEGLNLEQVMAAVLDGFREGSRDGKDVEVRTLVCALRNMSPETSLEMAELAVDFRDRGAVGFDLAGDESGHPPKKHLDAFQFLRRENFPITIHAGEAFGVSSIWQAIQYCGAHRIGHATRLYEDFHENAENRGTLAQYVLDQRILLEMCLSSNVHTGACDSLDEHPFPNYYREGFRVTLNTDNILMSNTTLSDEWEIAHRMWGLGLEDFRKLALNGINGSFLHYPERVKLRRERIDAVYDELIGS